MSEKRIIITADDYGESLAVNKGIELSCENGMITAVSVMANAFASEEAILKAKSLSVDIGVHLTLTQAKPVLPPQKVASLVGINNCFEKNLGNFLRRMLLGKLDFQEIANEFEAQITKVLDSGVKLWHLNTNQHIHYLPKVFHIVSQLAEKYKIPFVRLPYDYHWSLNKLTNGRNILHALFQIQKKRRQMFLKQCGLASTDYYFGAMDSGKVSKQTLVSVFESVPIGLTEFNVHPICLDKDTSLGWHEDASTFCDYELLTIAKENNVALMGFSMKRKEMT